MELKIKKIKLRRIGDSYHIIIPMGYIRNEVVNPNKLYTGTLNITEVN